MKKCVQGGIAGIAAIAFLGVSGQENSAKAFSQPNIGTIVGTTFSHDIVCNIKGLANFTGYASNTGIQYFTADSEGKIHFNNGKPIENPYAFLDNKTSNLYFDPGKDGTFDYFSGLEDNNYRDICEEFLEKSV